MSKKMRVWHIPQLGMNTEPFYVYVDNEIEGKIIMDMLAAYDMYQLQNNIKPDYANANGLHLWNDKEQIWEDWWKEVDSEYYDDIEEYLYSDDCPILDRIKIELNQDRLFSQIDAKLFSEMN